MVQAHPEALQNERVTQVTLFCFCPSEQILVINIGYFKDDIIEYHGSYDMMSGDTMKEKGVQINIHLHSIRCEKPRGLDGISYTDILIFYRPIKRSEPHEFSFLHYKTDDILLLFISFSPWN